MLDGVLSKLDQNRSAIVERLKTFLKIPSVSTRDEHRGDVRSCAQWLAEQLRQMKLDARICDTAGHPVVLAKSPQIAGRPTVLFYGHYDVQPVEPLDLWTTPPFAADIRDNAVYARGSSDDKGQVWAHIEAIRAWQDSGGLPVNVILMLEGEEEIGSPNLRSFMEQYRNELQADVAVISDSGQFARGLPSILYGLRGLVYEEITVEGPSHDLHSGTFGGVVPNPANILCELIASLHDSNGRVNIPGFYDDVLPLQPREREGFRNLPFSEADFAKDIGLRELPGEEGYSVLERRWARPTCDVNGLTAGYQDKGAKTVIASRASAKVSMRLVPNQDSAKIHAAFEKALRERCASSVKLTVELHSGSEPIVIPLGSKAMDLASDAVKIGFGQTPVFMREGGSIPVVSLIKRLLNVDTLLVGFALPDDRHHSPNEKFDLDALHYGARTAAALYSKLAELR